MTPIIAVGLAAVLLIAAWLLGQLPTAAKRMAVAFGLAAFGSAVLRLAERRALPEAAQIALLIAAALGAIATAIWLIQPWLWGIDDYLAELQAQADDEDESEQP